MCLSLETDNVSLVTYRRAAEVVATHVSDVITATGNTPESVVEATGLTGLREHLSGATPFTLEALVTVGGFLHVPAASFLEGITQ